MELKELYQTIGGDYEKATARFLNEEMLKLFFKKYFDSPCFRELEQAMDAGDVKAAFEAAHSLKGLTLSMEFTSMAEPCVQLTEDLRAGVCTERTREYWQAVREAYLRIRDLWESK